MCIKGGVIRRCISNVKLLWVQLFFLVIGVSTFIVLLLVVGKESSDDLGLMLAMSVFLIWWLFLLGSTWSIPKKMNLVDGMGFLSLFIVLTVIVCLVVGGFVFVRNAYLLLGIIQTQNQAQLYLVKDAFFDNQVTKHRFSQGLFDKKKSLIRTGEKNLLNNADILDIKNYFDKPLKGYFAWNVGDVVVFCEAPSEGKSYDDVLIDCRVPSDKQNNLKGDIDLSKGLMIERKYLQMLPK